MQSLKSKQFIFILVVIIVGICTGVGVSALLNHDSTPRSDATGSIDLSRVQQMQESQAHATQETVVKTGVLDCLNADGGNTQNTSCAIGLKSDNGQNYTLRSDDPSLLGSIPSGQTVRVTGTVLTQATAFQASGVLKVQTIERL